MHDSQESETVSRVILITRMRLITRSKMYTYLGVSRLSQFPQLVARNNGKRRH